MTDLAADAPPTDLALTPPISMRWPPDVIAAADRLAAEAGPGVTRSVILRMACSSGMGAVEEFFTALRSAGR